MVRAIVQGNLDVNYVVASKYTALQCALNTVVNSGNVFLGNSAALNVIDKGVSCAGLVGLNDELNVTVLTGPSSLGIQFIEPM